MTSGSFQFDVTFVVAYWLYIEWVIFVLLFFLFYFTPSKHWWCGKLILQLKHFLLPHLFLSFFLPFAFFSFVCPSIIIVKRSFSIFVFLSVFILVIWLCLGCFFVVVVVVRQCTDFQFSISKNFWFEFFPLFFPFLSSKFTHYALLWWWHKSE